MADGGQTVEFDETNRARFVTSFSVDDSDLHQKPELRRSFSLKDLMGNKKKKKLEQELVTYRKLCSDLEKELNEEKAKADKTQKRCTNLVQQLKDARDKIRRSQEKNVKMQKELTRANDSKKEHIQRIETIINRNPYSFYISGSRNVQIGDNNTMAQNDGNMDQLVALEELTEKLTVAVQQNTQERTNTEIKLRNFEVMKKEFDESLDEIKESFKKLYKNTSKKLKHDIELLEVLTSDRSDEHVITDGISHLKRHVEENNDSSQLPIATETAITRLVNKFGFELSVSEYSDIYDNSPEDYLIQNIIEVQMEHNRSTASQTINIDEIRARVRQFLHNKQFISNHEELTNVLIMTLIIGDRGQADSSARDLKETLDSSGTADWIFFVLSGNKKIAKRLLRMGKLPGQSTLNEMSLKFGRKSKITLYTCKAICEYIKSKHKKITDVWAAYKVENPDKICFVVCLQDNVESIEESELGKQKINPIRLNKIIEYTFVKRIVGEYSNESADIITNNVTSFEHLDYDAHFKLQECVAKYSVELINDHKYLSVVSACNKRSRDYGLPSWELETQDCIVLYVHTKHYIPINEEPFKELYGGFPVDVREGVFTPFGRTAKDYLEHLQMGCQIRGEIKNGQYRQGTLGCFLDHPQYGVCGMTCAHVLLESWEFIQLKTLYNGSLNWPLHNMCNKVYQPADRGTNVGHAVKVVYKEGSDRASGIDVALFKITSRLPKNSDFPEPSVTGSATLTNIDYEHWRICSDNRINKKMKDVVKFGANTEMRAGQIEFGTTSVQELNSYPLVSGYFAIKLHKQIEVRSADPSFKFADGGDSGALVFTVGESSSEHTCIGIVEGGTSYGTVVVTPILPILEEFNVPCFLKILMLKKHCPKFMVSWKM